MNLCRARPLLMRPLLLKNNKELGFFEWELGSKRAQFPFLFRFSRFRTICYHLYINIFAKKVDKGVVLWYNVVMAKWTRFHKSNKFLSHSAVRCPHQSHKFHQISLKNKIGVWHSLVVRLVRDQEAAGSNPVTPTKVRKPQKISPFLTK